MPMSWGFHRLLLAWTCLCVRGAPLHLPNVNNTGEIFCEGQCAGSVTTAGSRHTSHEESTPSDAKLVTGLTPNVGAGGGTDPHGRPEGVDSMTQEENGDSLDRRSRPREIDGEAWSQGSEVETIETRSEMGESKKDADVNSEHVSLTGGGEQVDFDMSTPGWTTSSDSSSQLDGSYNQKSKQSGEDGTTLSSFASIQDGDPATDLPSFTEPPNVYTSLWTQKMASQSPIPPLMFVTPRTSTSLTIWSHDGATISPSSDTILPEMGPNPIPREDALESLWTEAASPTGADAAVSLSQDDAIEAAMSSKAFPVIFEPVEDATAEGTAAAAAAAAAVDRVSGGIHPPGAMATRGVHMLEVDMDQLITAETDREGPSQYPPVLLPDWTSSWQTSGAELPEPISPSGPSFAQRQLETDPEDHGKKDAVKTSNPEENIPSTDPSLSSIQFAMTTVTMETHQRVHNSRTGLEEMESEEELDEEEEDDENSEESVEDESEEDLTEAPKTSSSTQPPYSLILHLPCGCSATRG
ncbi:uncharacterized protein LOC133464548 [Cololabis saira]|uniref:uncharacterized protein LOC133464548 n=1 Tax=Cololabis saira TaxID=129043 RepID=UPI002AD3A51E|nr:uncharacterized protein LOC133464548 [Cololabis saira]XP_061602580.1 uncharacterized protein LOC133464548 [Cololabis saira]XP_061602581.1 uncharacterized protein LOC133464548 [Cololabis saira]